VEVACAAKAVRMFANRPRDEHILRFSEDRSARYNATVHFAWAEAQRDEEGATVIPGEEGTSPGENLVTVPHNR
jgi:hypothetical protein